jgi:polyphosphate kinase
MGGSAGLLTDEGSPSPVLTVAKEKTKAIDRASRYLNRELSWLEFNLRVLGEALDPRTPLLERVRFLSIFYSNLDEFFMIRVSGLRTQMAEAATERSADGLTPAEQLAAIRNALLPTLEQSTALWRGELLAKLRDSSVRVLSYLDLKKKQRKLLRRHFKRMIFPALTPLAFDPGHPFPHISNLSINLAVVVRGPNMAEKFARLRAPATLPRLVRIPDEEKADSYAELGLQNIVEPNFVWLEEVIGANLDLLFPKMEVVASHPFRVTRDADAEIEEDEAGDLLTAVSDGVGRRHFGRVVRLEIDGNMPERIRDILIVNLELSPYQVFTTTGPLGLADLGQLASLDLPQLKFPPLVPTTRRGAQHTDDIFKRIAAGDMILYHPYDSFDTVLEFLGTAARDPDVIAIKQTLYRVGPASPIVGFLKEARENEKQVAALVELKARFDEENNIVWARELEEAGVHVVYGILGLKTHAKMTLVVRREGASIRLYVHLSTGNYNPVTSRMYTDIGLLTCDPDIARDVLDLFNGLTGYSGKTEYKDLIVAPGTMRAHVLERIQREVACQRAGQPAHIAMKCNSLSDDEIIDALYRASSAGVKIELQVRGKCCLRPGVPGLSDNIVVTSVVGRFLEHARLFYFANGGAEELFLGSADMMQRNLDRRVEVLFPIKDPALRARVRDSILRVSFADTAKCWQLVPDGSYERRSAAPSEEPFSSQEHFMTVGGSWREHYDGSTGSEARARAGQGRGEAAGHVGSRSPTDDGRKDEDEADRSRPLEPSSRDFGALDESLAARGRDGGLAPEGLRVVPAHRD